MNAFTVVEQFERSVAEYAHAKYAVAVNTGTSAIFLSLMFHRNLSNIVECPARTFISVPMACVHAGLKIRFEDYQWTGGYQLSPFPVWDGALTFHKGMYKGGLHCLSFHARKVLNIGEGGMVLTDDEEAYEWLKRARYSGRGGSFRVEDVEMIGWQAYMTPEKAARGLHLMEYVEDEIQRVEYPDLREVKAFQPHLATMLKAA